MPYIEFEEYTQLGFCALKEAEFARFAMLASDYIDAKTRRRATAGAGFDEELKKTAALIAESFAGEEKLCPAKAAAAGRVVKSESNDGWSASYETMGTAAADNFERGREDVLRRYLGHSGWLYCGVDAR